MRLAEVNRTTLNSFLEQEGFTAIAENLGVDVNQTNTYGETPLHVAALNGQLDVARLLLENGAEVNQALTNGATPLWVAAHQGQLDVAKLLLEGGADVNQANTYGATPLHVAAHQGQLDVVKLLIQRGAEVNKALTNGPFEGETPLYIAAKFGKFDVARLLLEGGAEVNQALTNGVTPLWVAAHQGQLDVARLLLENGAEVNQARTDDGATPLHVAAQQDELAVVKLLIQRGAEVNQTNTYGATPLHVAAKFGKFDVARLLLENGAEVNQARTDDGATPLYIAAQQGHTTVTLLLKLAGAKRGAIDFDTNDKVIKQALKASAMLEIITQRFPASATDLQRAIETTLDNITSIGNLFSFNEGLERKFNKIIHPSSTADISHMVNQFLPGKLPDELIGKIANPEIENLAEHDLRGAINTGAIVAQIITDHLQEQAVQAPAQTVAATKIQALVRGRKGREEAQEVKAQTTQNAELNDSWLFGPVEQHEVTVETGQTHVEMLAARRQADSIKSCCTIS